MQQLLGYSMEELLSTNFASLVHKEDLPLFEDWNSQSSTNGAVPSSSSLRFINKAGEELWVQLNPVSITWDGATCQPQLLARYHSSEETGSAASPR